MQDKLQSPSIFIGINGGGYISFGSGQPDLPPPKQVFKILPTFRDFKYGLVQGQLNLRKAISNEFKMSNLDSTEKNFVITNGASEALDLVFRANCKIKDKVLLHVPYYYSYPHLLIKNNFIPVFTETIAGKIDLNDFDKKVRDCKAVLINSPSNPTGRIQDLKTLKEIEKITKDLNIMLVSDEVYKDLIYERENYMLHGNHVVTINSFSKTYSMCGFRIGYLYSNDLEIIKKVVELKTYSSMNTNILGQEMAYEAMKTPKSFIKAQVKIWKERRDLIYGLMQELGLDLWKPEGAFYVFPKVKNPRKFVWDLFTKHKIITYLGEWFGAKKRVRFSYALDKEKIEKGLRVVGKYLASN